MKLSFIHYNLLCILAIFGLILTYVSCDIVLNHDLGVHLPIREKDYVLYFGDSVSFSYGKCDTGNRAIYDWLQIETKTNIIPVVKVGFSPIVYKDIISVFLSQKVLPKTIIIPINMRCFNQGWNTRPSVNYDLIRIKSKIRYEDFNLNDVIQYLKLRFSDVLTKEMKLWEQQKIIYEDLNLGVLSELHRKMKIEDDLDCHPNLKQNYTRELGTQFQYHYMYQLNESHRMISGLKDTLNKAKARNIKTVLYISPLNYKDGERFAGNEFAKRLNRNLRVLKKILDKEKVDYIDLSKTLPPERFVDQNHACGHLDNEGRRYIARQIVINYF